MLMLHADCVQQAQLGSGIIIPWYALVRQFELRLATVVRRGQRARWPLPANTFWCIIDTTLKY